MKTNIWAANPPYLKNMYNHFMKDLLGLLLLAVSNSTRVINTCQAYLQIKRISSARYRNQSQNIRVNAAPSKSHRLDIATSREKTDMY